MHPATLNGVGVITKLYFAIFVAFKESMTLNLAQRSFKVIDFGSNRKHVYVFLLVVNSNLDPILTVSEIRRLKCRKLIILFTPLLFRLIFGVFPNSLWSRSVVLWSAESEMVRLISREIIFAELQPIWSRYLNITDTTQANSSLASGHPSMSRRNKYRWWLHPSLGKKWWVLCSSRLCYQDCWLTDAVS